MNARLCNAIIIKNEEISTGIFLLKAAMPSKEPLPKAGQFYMLRTWGQSEAPVLSRPISVHDVCEEKHEVHFLYEIRGIGTKKLSQATVNSALSLTGAAGNGFPVADISGKVALVSGGVGIAPMLLLAKELKNSGCTVDLYAGFKDKPYALDSFSKICAKIKVATDSGNYGEKGFVTELLEPKDYDFVCTCGPDIMMSKTAILCQKADTPCYVSLETKMACGVGACLGCKSKTIKVDVHICKDGPVFLGELIYAEH